MTNRESEGMVQVEIPYGNSVMRFRVPERALVEVLRPSDVRADLADEALQLEKALDEPIGTARLEDLLQPDHAVAVIVDDISRPTPVQRVLPAILERIERSGVPDDRVTIVIALGTHRPMTPEEIRMKLGEETTRRFRVENHDFQDPDKLVYVGRSSDGIPVWINRRVHEADFRIAVGNIVPHGVAGWAGGGKIIYPGVAGADTVDGFHGAFGTNTRNRLGADHTPIREDIERLVGYVGLEFIVNTVLTGDGIIYRVVAGDFRLAHRKGVEHARKVYAVPCQQAVDVAVVSSHPADIDFWQAGKALYSGELLLRDGGTLILVTPCPEGVVQNHDLLHYLSFSPDELLQQLLDGRAEDRAAAAAALRVGMVTQRVQVVVVSEGLSEQDARAMGFQHARHLQKAVDQALAEHGENGRLSVLTHGGDLFPERRFNV